MRIHPPPPKKAEEDYFKFRSKSLAASTPTPCQCVCLSASCPNSIFETRQILMYEKNMSDHYIINFYIEVVA